MILSGEETTTWRLFDEKNLKKRDIIDLINWDTKEVFSEAEITGVWEKKMGELDDNDLKEHEEFSNKEEMYQIYRSFYGDKVGPDTTVKVVLFKLI